MNEAMRIHGLCAIRLDQRRYKDGRLFVSAVLQDDELVAVDVRFFVEDGPIVMPTRQGFRVPVKSYWTFIEQMRRCIADESACTVWERNNRSLRMTYCDDEYGKGVNLRYFQQSPKYTGPERRGIRLTLRNFASLHEALERTNLAQMAESINVFAGREIRPFRSQDDRTRSTWRGDGASARDSYDGEYVNDVIADFLISD